MTTKHQDQSGFTLIETLVAISLLVIGAAMALTVTSSTMTSMRADGQVRRLVQLVQLGRELAISTRRDHELVFDIPQNTVRLMRMNGGLPTEVESLIFEYGVRLMTYPGLGDTPEGYGAGGVVNFGSATRFIFESDGSFIDETGLPLNGTVFLGMQNKLQAARAITVTGTTARPRMYRWDSSQGAGSWATR